MKMGRTRSLYGNYFDGKSWKKDWLFFNSKFIQTESQTSEKFRFEDFYITPALIESHSHVGLCPIAKKKKQEMLNTPLSKVRLNSKMSNRIDLGDIALARAKKAGISTIAVDPGSKTPYSGLGLIVGLDGKKEYSITNETSSYKISLGEIPEGYSHLKGDMIRRKIMDVLKEGKVRKDIPIKAHVYTEKDIEFVAELNKLGFEVIALHAASASKMRKSIIKKFKGIILGPLLHPSTSVEGSENTFENAIKIFRKRSDCCVSTDHPVTPIELLRLNAIVLNSNGLSEKKALHSITLNPAKTLNLSQIYGSLDYGKYANFCVFSGHPLEIKSKLVALFSKGNEIYISKEAR